MDSSSDTKLYTPWQIAWGTFLGGPLAGSYLLSKNFKGLGKPRQAKKMLYGGVVGTVLLFTIVSVLSVLFAIELPITGSLITAWFLVLAKSLQGPAIKEHLQQGGKKYSAWRATGIGIVSLVVTLFFLAVFTIAYIMIEGTV